MKKVLITGIGGGQGQLVARTLLRRQRGYQIVGVDRTPWEGRPRGVSMAVADLRKRKFEDVIRRERPDVIVHLASVRHFKSHPALRHEVPLAIVDPFLFVAHDGRRRVLTSVLEAMIPAPVRSPPACRSSSTCGRATRPAAAGPT